MVEPVVVVEMSEAHKDLAARRAMGEELSAEDERTLTMADELFDELVKETAPRLKRQLAAIIANLFEEG